jgi:3-phenylpropionate/cinnamic acid dioxygenase small subunit
MMATDLRREVEQFLYHEALLIDERRFDEWTELFTDDALYWIPNLDAASDPSAVGPIVYDDRSALSIRAARLQHPSALTQNPPPRTRHFISNLIVREQGSDECATTANQLVYVTRGASEAIYPGWCEHLLRRVDGGWRIARKKVCLLNNDRALAQIPLL